MSAVQQVFAALGGTAPGQQAYTTPGTYSWVCPAGVTSVSVVCIGAGGERIGSGGYGGGGGGLAYGNNISVTPGASYTVVVGAHGGNGSYFSTAGTLAGGGGKNCNFSGTGGTSTGSARTGGGTGGAGGPTSTYYGGGGGAAGYSGTGGAGANGDARFVHAPSSNGRVRIDRLGDRYYAQRYEAARTFFD